MRRSAVAEEQSKPAPRQIGDLVDVALKIEAERVQQEMKIVEALKKGDDQEALRASREFYGLH